MRYVNVKGNIRMLGFRLAAVVVGVGLIAGVCGCSAKASARQAGTHAAGASLIKPGKGLFHSHEFRSSLRALPNWSRVMASAEGQVAAMSSCGGSGPACSSAALSWQKIITQTRPLDTFTQLKQVNTYFNRWPYRLDIDVYGASDYWATPREFLQLSGDCEDYSITKYYALRAVGFDANNLRIVLLKDTIRNISHAVLAAKLEDETYILDNLSDLVLPHGKYEHYVPQFSVNEFYRWAHISPGSIRPVSP